ncbi:DUF5403 family protein [Actinocrispum wychmicini]|uniref:Uncharacterized protein n=1 Tax=Actinocrispum wychmicini TaxID=1213861 RepID=A0A4R2JIH5_9PSEU|nr:DUF5403 family protein [Actinocrispum wychmicini]TCO56796.1 hypothetical protein EV192_106271 [Actinocrispum wychmicini]
MAERRYSNRTINSIVAHLDGVTDAVHHRGTIIAARAETFLDMHRDSGHAEIDLTRHQVDTLVSLVDEAALSIEFGHIHNKTGRYVHGLYIVTRAAH